MIKLIKSTFFNETDTKEKLTEFITQAEMLSFSEQCQSFESNFSKYQERAESIFVNSGSSANLAVIQSLMNLGRLKKGDKVGFSAITWSTNVMPLLQLGLVPIPIDVELDTLNTSSEIFEKAIKKYKIKAFFITNLLGFCDDIDVIAQICQQNNVLLIEDNCESLGSVHAGKKLGNFGIASTFSFYVGHHMSTIEGGMVCTDDEELATMIRLVRAHGWDRNLSEKNQTKIRSRYKVNSSFYSRYTFYDLGYNLRPTEINGFLGNNQLKYLDEITRRRSEIFSTLSEKIYANPEYMSLDVSHMDFVSNFAIPVICKSVEKRDELVKKCDGKVEIRPVVGGDMTRQPFFGKYLKKKLPEMKNAHLIHSQGLYFGNNPELTNDEIETLINVFL